MERQNTEEMNILVVDDEIMNIKMAERILRDIPGLNIIPASNREETLTALENNDTALILLDLRMPDIDGFELYRMIRKRWGMPVVLMTADLSPETLREADELGIGGCLGKPLNKLKTQEMICRLVGRCADDLC